MEAGLRCDQRRSNETQHGRLDWLGQCSSPPQTTSSPTLSELSHSKYSAEMANRLPSRSGTSAPVQPRITSAATLCNRKGVGARYIPPSASVHEPVDEQTPDVAYNRRWGGWDSNPRRRIMRSTPQCTTRSSCTDGTDHRTGSTHHAEISSEPFHDRDAHVPSSDYGA
jgi:hypothetical protein